MTDVLNSCPACGMQSGTCIHPGSRVRVISAGRKNCGIVGTVTEVIEHGLAGISERYYVSFDAQVTDYKRGTYSREEIELS